MHCFFHKLKQKVLRKGKKRNTKKKTPQKTRTYSTYLNWSLFLDTLQGFLLLTINMLWTPFLTLFSFATCGKIHSTNKDELSKRADTALSSNVSFISVLFFPRLPTWTVEGPQEWIQMLLCTAVTTRAHGHHQELPPPHQHHHLFLNPDYPGPNEHREASSSLLVFWYLTAACLKGTHVFKEHWASSTELDRTGKT